MPPIKERQKYKNIFEEVITVILPHLTDFKKWGYGFLNF